MQTTPDSPLEIYAGPLTVETPKGLHDGQGQITFVWLPRPGIVMRFDTEDFAADLTEFHPTAVRLPDGVPIPDPLALSGTEQPEDGTYWERFDISTDPPRATSTIRLRELPLGDDGAITTMRFAVINFKDVPLPSSDGHASQEWFVGEWRVSLHGADTTEAIRRLNRTGAYAITHWIQIEKRDRTPFASADSDNLRLGLLLILSFMHGAVVGQALVTGLDADGRVCHFNGRVSIVSPWRSTLTWFDSNEIGALGELLTGWMQRASDPFWRETLGRAIRMVVSANDCDPVDDAVITGFIALEVLAWAVLVATEDWIRPGDGEMKSEGQIRLLLRWAGIETRLPQELAALRAYAGGHDNLDGPSALAFIRNRLVHPPKKPTSQWPSAQALLDAYFLELEFADLVVLKLLGYTGVYGHRGAQGRWIGDTHPVPWAMTTTQSC